MLGAGGLENRSLGSVALSEPIAERVLPDVTHDPPRAPAAWQLPECALGMGNVLA